MHVILHTTLDKLTAKEQKAVHAVLKRCFACSVKKCLPFADDKIYLMAIGGKIAGLAMIHHESPLAHIEQKHQRASYIYNFCIDPSYRIRGHATLGPRVISMTLMDHIVAAEGGHLNLDTRADAPGIIARWEQYGFRSHGPCPSIPGHICMTI